MMMKNKNIVVTGAAGGIGKAILIKLANEGANIWACDRKQPEEFEQFLKDLAAEAGSIIEPVYFNLDNEEEIKTAVKYIVQSKRPVDGIVNNAGIAAYNKLQFMKVEDIKRIFNINYFSSLYLTQLLLRRITKQTGSIVFTSSIAGFKPEIGNVAYGGSKAAVSQAVKVLAKELSPDGIRVNAVAPGLVDTDMKNKADETTWNLMIQNVMLGRIARPEEIANVICFLLSEQSSFITAQTIHVDGGMF